MARAKTEVVRQIGAYGLMVFGVVELAMTLRSASLIWIHGETGMGADPWWLFRRHMIGWAVVAAVQAGVMMLMLAVSRRVRARGPGQMALAVLSLCILDVFIEPIGIWTSGYGIFGPLSIFAAVLLFPVLAWLTIFALPTGLTGHKS